MAKILTKAVKTAEEEQKNIQKAEGFFRRPKNQKKTSARKIPRKKTLHQRKKQKPLRRKNRFRLC